HGFFDGGAVLKKIAETVALSRGKSITTGAVEDYRDRKETVYDKLAETLKKSLDMDRIYKILGLER
ncbi:MAG: cobyric acid synthase CobQ, partial [Lachnospiraceae bacterium]|nr:cobyric acid synthase CobQ [Lachnospiraceae bacterium]